MDLLANRISESVNELGLQIDILYRLSEKDRQSFLNKIQIFKTSLIGLKSTLKVTNKELIQSQYKIIRIEIIGMKKMIETKLEQVSFKNANQQNKSIQQNRLNSLSKIGNKNNSMMKNNESLFETSVINRSFQNTSKIGIMKHINKKQYEQLMNNIVEQKEKNEQISQEIQKIKEQNHQLKYLNASLEQKVQLYEPEIQKISIKLNLLEEKLLAVEKTLKEKQSQLAQAKDREMQSKNKCNHAFIQISQLKNQLDNATSKIIANSNLEEISLYKINALQQTISKFQSEILLLNEQNNKKQLQITKKSQSFQQYQQLYNEGIKRIGRLQLQLHNQREDITVLESQLTKSQKQYYELKIEKESVEIKLQSSLAKQKQECFSKIQEKNKEFQILKQMLTDSEQFSTHRQGQFQGLKGKIQEFQAMYLAEKNKRETIEDILSQTQGQFQKERQAFVCDIELKKIEICKLSSQVQKSLELTKSLQEEINQIHLNRNKVREDQRVLSKQYKEVQIKNIQLNQKYLQLQSLFKEVVSELNQKKNQIVVNKNFILSLENQLKQTRVRLHKAKIQAINDIRSTLF